MKIAITGASGFVGRQLVEKLGAAGHRILPLGREPSRLKQLFPALDVAGYDELVSSLSGCDIVIHSAVANTNSNLPDEAIHSVNVDLPTHIAEAAALAGVHRFIHLSSIHALDQNNSSAYARTKRESARRLLGLAELKVTVLYLATVRGERFAGKLSFLNRFPQQVASSLFSILASLKPTVHIDHVVEAILGLIDSGNTEAEIVLTDDQSQNGWYMGIKRAIDLGFSVAVIGLLGWLLALVWVAIKLQSPGPGIFSQERVGRFGETFTCYKFRTMKQGTVQAGTHEISASSVTGLGAFLRATKIDELPQVLNLLRNEMTLVGPRPCLPVQDGVISARRKLKVDHLKPGITGLSQINGIDMSDPEKLAEWDNRYKVLRSLILDMKILLATALGGGRGDRVDKG